MAPSTTAPIPSRIVVGRSGYGNVHGTDYRREK
jgi:hypothetical protein